MSSEKKFKTEHEAFWAGEFGTEYIQRNQGDALIKRDFAGEIMDRHPQIQLVDYGFAYRRDPSFPQDDITWFLLEKN